jgi:RHS repeat-associated protein
MEMTSLFARTVLSLGLTLLVTATGVAKSADLPAERSALVVLPNGERLELGGVVGGNASAEAAITSDTKDPKPLKESMLHPRSEHTATVLPDGRVLIWGGVDDSGNIVREGEWFDPTSGHFSEAHGIALLPRAGHTATVLTDGRVLVLGGHAEDLGPLVEAEVWDWRTNRSELLPVQLAHPREGHTASLLADGRVLIVGPDAKDASLYDPERVRFLSASHDTADASAQGAGVRVVGASPQPDAKDVPLDSLLALRFDPPLAPESANEKTITLFGPHGTAPVRVVAAESGRLVFVTPVQELFPASHYTVFVQGVHDAEGQGLVWHALEFDTQRFMPSPLDPRLDLRGSPTDAGATAQPRAAQSAPTRKTGTTTNTGTRDGSPAGKPYVFLKPSVTDDEVWIPSEANLGGKWRTQRPLPADIRDAINLGMSKNSQKAAWRSRRLRSGVTEVSGRILRFNDRPLGGVDVRIGEVRAMTDNDGRFSLKGIKAGHQELVVDGNTAGKDGNSFAQFVIGMDVEAGKENPVKPIYLPKIRPQDWIDIPSPLPADLVVKNPSMPGFEVHLPTGTILRGRDGKVVRRVAIIPIPLDRTPINYPVNTPLHMTFQPGGMSIEGLTPGVTKGIQFVYPNYGGEAPGARAGFINYDPTAKGWYTYGYGSVSADGLSIFPDAETQIYSATGFGVYFGSPPPWKVPCYVCDGDPVDLRTGLFKHSTQGPAIADVVPIEWQTTYRPADIEKRGFGYGTSFTYGMYLYDPNPNPHAEWNEFDLVLPDGAVVKFPRTSGSTHEDFFGTHTATPTSYYGATLAWNVAKQALVLTKRDGTKFDFSEFGGGLMRVADRFGRTVEITASGGLISRVATESGRYVDVQYDTQNRIKDLGDITGRHWQYAYTTAGYLDHVTYPDTTHENFTYDTQGRMTDVFDRRGNRMVHNTYDSDDRVTDQILADGAIFHFDYVADAQGLSTQVDVTRPNGSVRRVVFDSSGNLLADTRALGTVLEQAKTYERDSVGFITATTDALDRRTERGYDSDKQVTSVTRLAKTDDALTTTFTYTAAHDLHTVTDPWGRITTYTFDAKRHLKRVDDDARWLDLSYDDLDRVTQVTDHLNRTTSFGYDLYDVRTVTDPLLRTTTRFVDTLGRLAAIENPLHQREETHYDINDRVQSAVDAGGATTMFTYDALGNLLTLTDPLNHTTAWTYDARQRPLTRTDALQQQESWTYAPDETAATHTDRMNRTTSTTFDALGRVATRDESDGRHLAATYDPADRLLSLADSAGPTTTYGYTPLDQVLSESGAAGAIAYTYDDHARRQSRTLSGQPTMTYAYDTRDRLASLTQGGDTVTFGYDTADRRTRTTLPNGIVTTATFDDADRLMALTYTSMSAPRNAPPLGDLNYGYDAADRIVGRTGTWSNSALPAATNVAGTVDANNRLTGFNGQSLSYDAAGNLIDDGVNHYVYDARNKLTQITQGGVTTASFTYDVFGRRLSKTIGTVTTSYRYDGDNPIEETTAGQVSAILSGPGIDERYGRDEAGGRAYYLTDNLGSVVALANGSGTVTAQYVYEPYGEVTSTGSSDNPYQYTGRENDGTGLYYYRARYYSTTLKRFINEDPVGLAAGLNVYGYVHANPLSFTDPFGLDESNTIVCGPNGTMVVRTNGSFSNTCGADTCLAAHEECHRRDFEKFPDAVAFCKDPKNEGKPVRISYPEKQQTELHCARGEAECLGDQGRTCKQALAPRIKIINDQCDKCSQDDHQCDFQ